MSLAVRLVAVLVTVAWGGCNAPGPALPGPLAERSGHYFEPIRCKGTATRPPAFVERGVEGAGGRSTPARRGAMALDHWRRVVLPERLDRAVGAVTVADVARGARQYIARPAVVFVQSPEVAGP